MSILSWLRVDFCNKDSVANTSEFSFDIECSNYLTDVNNITLMI